MPGEPQEPSFKLQEERMGPEVVNTYVKAWPKKPYLRSTNTGRGMIGHLGFLPKPSKHDHILRNHLMLCKPPDASEPGVTLPLAALVARIREPIR